jgi:2-polyprenyl-3-methyl-5-hydroxy-6-metoxy-1,4-benzoquinol methylase
VGIIPEMIEWASQKAAKQGVSIEWVVADARTFHLQKQFPFISLLGNAFQHFLTRADQEALLARVWEHLHPQGCFLFGTRNPSLRNLLEARYPRDAQRVRLSVIVTSSEVVSSKRQSFL